VFQTRQLVLVQPDAEGQDNGEGAGRGHGRGLHDQTDEVSPVCWKCDWNMDLSRYNDFQHDPLAVVPGCNKPVPAASIANRSVGKITDALTH
jgi:hypothetical protein